MEIREIILGLQDLAQEAESHFNNYGDDEIFHHDYDVCMAAIDTLKRCTQTEVEEK